MPFGLSNTLVTFQAYINKSLVGLLDHFVVVYLDDILIYSKDLEQYHEHVQQVLARLRKYKLYAKLSKCEFDIQEVEFLGFIVSLDGVRADPKRIRSITKWPELESFYEIQVFLGFTNFYRRFVHRYSYMTSRLIDMLTGIENRRKTGPYHFSKEARESLMNLKHAFS